MELADELSLPNSEDLPELSKGNMYVVFDSCLQGPSVICIWWSLSSASQRLDLVPHSCDAFHAVYH